MVTVVIFESHYKASGRKGVGRGVNEGRAGPQGRAARWHLSPLFPVRSQGHFTKGRPGKTSPLITKNSPSSNMRLAVLYILMKPLRASS